MIQLVGKPYDPVSNYLEHFTEANLSVHSQAWLLQREKLYISWPSRQDLQWLVVSVVSTFFKYSPPNKHSR